MSPIEEGGKTARSVIDAMRDQPAMLTLIVLQFLVFASIIYFAVNRQDAINQQFSSLHALLEKCLTARLGTGP